MNDGHIVRPAISDLRHAPIRAQRFAAPRIPPSNEKLVAIGNALGSDGLAQMLRHARRVHLLSRIEPAARIEQLLERTHRAVQLVAEDPRVELAAHETVAVLAAVRCRRIP